MSLQIAMKRAESNNHSSLRAYLIQMYVPVADRDQTRSPKQQDPERCIRTLITTPVHG